MIFLPVKLASGRKVENNFATLLARRAEIFPDCVAVRWIERDLSSKETTYLEIHRRSAALAYEIHSRLRGNCKGARVILLYDSGIEFIVAFFACLYAGAIAVPVVPPMELTLKKSPLGRIIEDAKPSLILTDKANLLKWRALLLTAPKAFFSKWMASDSLMNRKTQALDKVQSVFEVDPDDIAFLQYTSGSTGNPKGVQVSHRNLHHNCFLLLSDMGYEAGKSNSVFWVPHFHDMGLIGGILLPIYSGVPASLIKTTDFLGDPSLWLRAISKFKGTHTAAPNFAFALTQAKTTDAQIAEMNLSSLKVALCAAEPANPRVLRAFYDRFRPAHLSEESIWQAYGLAEATLYVTSKANVLSTWDGKSEAALSSGFPRLSTHHRIRVDEKSGEILVGGQSVTSGYFGRNRNSEGFSTVTDPDSGESYREVATGDLGFLKDGEVYISGRKKDLIIKNGRNIHPSDVENTLSAADSRLRSRTALIATGSRLDPVITAVLEVRSRLGAGDAPEIFDCVRNAVFKGHGFHLNRILLSKKGSIPRTTSGKTKRSFLKEQLEAGKFPFLEESVSNISLSRQPEPSDAEVQNARAWIRVKLGELTGQDPSLLDGSRSFPELGLESIHAVGFARLLSERFSCELSPTVFFEHKTLDSLVSFLVGQGSSGFFEAPRSELVASAPKVASAIIGIAGRFPGANSWPELRELFKTDRSLFQAPESRWDYSQFHHSISGVLEGTGFEKGAFLENPYHFDAGFFHVSDREATLMDPQQRIYLETVWHALQDAGYDPNEMKGKRVAVFTGVSSHDYSDALLRAEVDDFYLATGNAFSILSNRVSHFFNWNGPSISIDTACSSSLVALHEARQAMERGECDLAIVGAVNLILSPQLNYLLAKMGALSETGVCHPFDERANGYVRAEGVCAIVLKPENMALRDQDAIYARILGSAVGHGGRSASLTAPSSAAQAEIITEALQDANLDPSKIHYIEAHGTGTPLGDPIEIEGLQKVFDSKTYSERLPPLSVGTVKSQLGHLEAAAGLAGILHAIEFGNHRFSSALKGFRTINPLVKIKNSRIRLGNAISSPPTNTSLNVGVSSFGFGGTNAHVVLSVSKDPRLKSIPLKRFDRKEFRFDSASSPQKNPLVGINVSNLREYAHEVELTGTEHFLVDHVLNGKKVLPGVAYLEAALQIGERLIGKPLVLLQNIRWLAPFLHQPSQAKIRFVLKEFDAGFLFRAFDRDGILLFSCEIPDQQAVQPGLVTEVFEAEWNGRISGPTVYESFMRMGAFYGPSFQAIQELRTSPSQILSEIWVKSCRIPYQLNPSFLDAALGAAVGWTSFFPTLGKHPFVPMSMERLEFFRVPGQVGTAVLSSPRHTVSESFERLAYDVEVFNSTRSLAVRMKGVLTSTLASEAHSKVQYFAESVESYQSLPMQAKRWRQVGLREFQVFPNEECEPSIVFCESNFDNYSQVIQTIHRLASRAKPVSLAFVFTGEERGLAYSRSIRSLVHALGAESRVSIFSCFRGARDALQFSESFERKWKRLTPGPEVKKLKRGIYLVSGGSGNLGEVVCRWIESHEGALPVVISRRPHKKVPSIVSDLSDAEFLVAEFTRLKLETGLPILGVFHLAGVLHPERFVDSTIDAIQRPLLPKVTGTENLDWATRNEALDFFCAFSSHSAIFGDWGMGTYAAANGFLDAYAELRNKSFPQNIGHAISVSLPRIAGAPMNGQLPFPDTGPALPIAEIPAILETALTRNESVLYVDFAKKSIFLRKTHEASPKERIHFDKKDLSSLQNSLKREIGEILHMDGESLEMTKDLSHYGADSLKLIELAEVLQGYFVQTIKLADVFEHSSIQKLSDFLWKLDDHSPQQTLLETREFQTRFPLSPFQQGLWIRYQQSPEDHSYHIPLSIRFPNGKDLADVERAIATVLQERPFVFSRFSEDQNGPYQQASPEPFVFRCLHLPSDEEEFLKTSNELVSIPFDLAVEGSLRAYVFQDEARIRNVLFVFHHLATDGLSVKLFLDLFLHALDSPRAPAAPQKLMRPQQASTSREEIDLYWSACLAAELPVYELPYRSSNSDRILGGEIPVSLEGIDENVAVFAKKLGVSRFSILLSVYALTLARFADVTEIVVAFPYANRASAEEMKLLGMAVNMLPVHLQFSEGTSFRDFVISTHDKIRQAMRLGHLSFYELAKHSLQKASPGTHPLFQVAFVYQNDGDLNGVAEKYGAQVDYLPNQSGQFDFKLELFPKSSGEHGFLKYRADAYAPGVAESLAKSYGSLARVCVENPDSLCFAFCLVPEREIRAVIGLGQGPKRPYRLGVFESFVEIATMHPALVAIERSGETKTYAELYREVLQTIAFLEVHGIIEGDSIGISGPPSFEYVSVMLACLAVKASFVPIDPRLPKARIQDCMSQANPKLIYGRSSISQVFEKDALPINECWYRPLTPNSEFKLPSDVAYVLFTSGSSGKPKGVLCSAKGLDNRMEWMKRRFRTDQKDKILQKTPISFDVSLWEFFLPLISGAALVLPDNYDSVLDLPALSSLIAESKITVLHFVPGFLRSFLKFAKREQFPSVRAVVSSGEALPKDLIRLCQKTFSSATLHNLYGPTEAAIDVTEWKAVGSDEEISAVPLGKPIDNVDVHVLDGVANPLPAYAVGEILIGGEAVAQGYLHLEEETRKRFLARPSWSKNSTRWYKTGDLAYRDAAGELIYLGRNDSQIKLNGNRIEIFEIESALSDILDHGAVAVVMIEDRFLAAVIEEGGDAVSEALIIERLAKKLPNYMLPSLWVRVDHMPLNSNGKIDRKALPTLISRNGKTSLTVSHQETDDAVVTHLRSLFKLHLFMQDIPGTRNLFQSGLTSLQAMDWIEQISETFQKRISLKDFYRHPTLKGLSALIRKDGAEDEQRDLDAIAEQYQYSDLLEGKKLFKSGALFPKTFFLTGGNGTLGREILLQLLRKTPDCMVLCLIRGGSFEQAETRFRELCGELRLTADETKRCEVVWGDAALPRLGLSENVFDALCDRVDHVFHSAARVHFLEKFEDLKTSNVDGTWEVIRFCLKGKEKKLAYVSTASVFASPDYMGFPVLNETMEPHSSRLLSGYAQSKWVAERLVRKGISENLPFQIYRVGTLTDGAHDSRASHPELFRMLMEAILKMGMIPDYHGKFDTLLASKAAKQMVMLATHPTSLSTFHLSDEFPKTAAMLESELKEMHPELKRASWRDWVEALQKDTNSPLKPLMNIFTEPVLNLNLTEAEIMDQIPPLSTSLTQQELQKILVLPHALQPTVMGDY